MSRPIPKAIIAPNPPIMATPNADMGNEKIAPRVPTPMPPKRTFACAPPWSPALMASAAAMPKGHGRRAGKAGVSNIR